MKQQQFAFTDESTLDQEMRKIRQWYMSNLCSGLLIQIYAEVLDRTLIERVCDRIQAQLPQASVIGCTTYGNIQNGSFTGGHFTVVCTLFEYPSTKVEVLQYPLTATTQREVTEKLRREVERRPWVKGVQLLVTIRGMSVSALCEGLSELPDDIQVFGGGAFSGDIERDEACVFSSAGGYSERGIVFVLFGGEELSLEATFLTGWKPLGRYLDVTAAQGAQLRELNGRPAYETYYKYLHIRNDENFFFNTLEFPFLYRFNGIDIMRAPTASNPDGSLTMTADISQGVKARIAYGDPWTILDAAWQQGNRLLRFAPESITVFSCAARRTFWGDAEVGKETEPYQIVAPTSGFYTSGEFLRTNGFVNQHNVTQVIVAMREGAPKAHPQEELRMSSHSFEGKVSMINRMATFIKATTEELVEANEKLAAANRALSEMAVTDALTGIGNKAAYLERIKAMDARIRAGHAAFSVAVFDMNGLKGINDNFGHECGDFAIVDLSRALMKAFGRDALYRIGGDEFIAVLDDSDEAQMARRFEALAGAMEEINRAERPYRVPLSVSRGCATFSPADDREYLDAFRRADEAMYRSKTAYYKTHDRRRRS